jgi:hypothetical protein
MGNEFVIENETQLVLNFPLSKPFMSERNDYMELLLVSLVE